MSVQTLAIRGSVGAMEQRMFAAAGRDVSAVGFGGWQIGADWGEVAETAAMETLHAAVDAGVTFFDTADVYGDGRSEQLIGRLRRERPEAGLFVATKMGRRLAQEVLNYSPEDFRAWNDRSRKNLGVDTLDLVQLHCPPTDLYYRPEAFAALEELVAEGRIARYGVSVERVEEGLKALEYPGLSSVQIIFNPFRQRPADLFLARAQERGVAVIVRVPLASGLLSGRYTTETTFAADDHRTFNRQGEAFDVGETFAGVPFEAGVEAAATLARAVRKACPCRRPRCGGSSRTMRSRPSFPAPAQLSRRGRTPSPGTAPRSRAPSAPPSPRCTRSRSRRTSVTAGEVGLGAWVCKSSGRAARILGCRRVIG